MMEKLFQRIDGLEGFSFCKEVTAIYPKPYLQKNYFTNNEVI